ncbi:MAG: DNA adenine methylase, partial [Oscillospiraceae bacterium]|nr:DNA adenine methylase [Oscillospiraceae bacterium]
MNSFISWVGGKMALRDEIIARFPTEYGRYIEVFGGAGWTLFRKPPEKFEVWNDFNSDLVNLYRAVKEHSEELIRALDWTLNSRADFNRLKMLFRTPVKLPDVPRAAEYFRLITLSYGSKCVSFGGQPCELGRRYPAIRGAHVRLGGVVIENKDFEALLRQYDREDAFFYLDPPYYGTEDYYGGVDFTPDDHARLRGALAGIGGKFLLSYNDCPEIRELYGDFNIEAIARLSNLSQRFEGGAE